MRIYLDTETFSELDVRKVGAYRYAEHESTEILMCAYAIDDDPVSIAVGPLELYEQFEPLLELAGQPDVLFVAQNATFDRVVISSHLGMPAGEYLDPAQWLDPGVKAACAGYPAGLDKMTKALKVQQKDSAGTLLINTFSKLNRKSGRNTAKTHPEKWAAFCQYCVNDVEAMRAADQLLPDQSAEERAIWIADQQINDRGVRLDIPMAHAAVAADAQNKEEARREVITLTGVENPGSGPQLLAWFAEQGTDLPNLKADPIKELLSVGTFDGLAVALKPVGRRVLELRQELALASAPAKFKAAVVMSNSDGRIRGAARYYGAHTGRWSGRGIQLQNTPRKSLGELEPLALLDLMSGFGALPETLKALVRPLLLGPLTVGDFSQIEARVIAWLSGEQWVLDAFMRGRDIYVETARRMGMEDPKGKGRQSGKSATLGLGFGGGIMALRNVGAQGDDEELEALVLRWRTANPRIRQYWYELWRAFVFGGTAGRLSVEKSNGIRRINLPSGRQIIYRGVMSREVQRISPKTEKPYTAYDVKFRHPTGKLTHLWHGVIIENVTQAIARDLMAGCLPVLEAMGVPVVAHVHDEIIAEGSYVEEMTQVMTQNPPWSDGIPLNVDCHVVERYTK